MDKEFLKWLDDEITDTAEAKENGSNNMTDDYVRHKGIVLQLVKEQVALALYREAME